MSKYSFKDKMESGGTDAKTLKKGNSKMSRADALEYLGYAEDDRKKAKIEETFNKVKNG